MRLEQVAAVRRDPRIWFQGFGYWLDDENNRKATRGPALVLQRRYFEHYRRCLKARKPCRIAGLKYRRASSSTAGNAILYHHSMNFPSRAGVIGKDYKSSSNMLAMVKTFAEHDDFPGWTGRAFREGDFKEIELEEGGRMVKKTIATRIEWHHGSVMELYTAENPASARSAGLQCYLATECGFWATEGVKDAAETLNAMRNTLPKKGFHVAIEESTAHGAAGAFYETCKAARWPDYAEWAEQWKSDWPLTEEPLEAARDLQFVFIFAAWFEDERNFYRISPADEELIRNSIDGETWYEGEAELIARYAQEGPRGQRLGGEVDATVWEQLAWRRAIIKQTGGLENFKQEYPSNPLEAFRASGAPVFDADGLLALEKQKDRARPEHGVIDQQPAGGISWRRTREKEAVFTVWEHPIEGCRYLMSCDPRTGSVMIQGGNDRDRHSVLLWRDRYQDSQGRQYPLRLVARIKPPCGWEDAPLARQMARLAVYYGDCCIAVENNAGVAIIRRLIDDFHCHLHVQQDWDSVKQAFKSFYGFRISNASDDDSRRMAVTTMQDIVREQRIQMECPHVLAEMKTFIFNDKGKAIGSGSNHDDDVMSMGIGLCCMGSATTYLRRVDLAAQSDAYRA